MTLQVAVSMALTHSQTASVTYAAPAGPWQEDAASWAGAAGCSAAPPPLVSVMVAAATAPATTTAPPPMAQRRGRRDTLERQVLLISLTPPSRPACWRGWAGPALCAAA